MTETTGTPPGWYDDGTGTQRWWDGTAWTDQIQPQAPTAPPPPMPAVPSPAIESKRPSRRKVAIFGGVGLLVLVAVIAVAGGSSSSSPSKPSTPKVKTVSADDAYFACQSFASKELSSPSTAKYPDTPVATSTVAAAAGSQSFNVTGYVDSQNALGATVRSNWSCDVTYNSETDTWTKDDLTIGAN